MILVFLVYGLAFVVLGVAIFVAPRTATNLPWARDLQWIGWFGVLHGANEWIDMLKLVDAARFEPAHGVVGPLLLASSFACLLAYGGRFLARDCRLTPVCRWLPLALIALWGVIVALAPEPRLAAHLAGRYVLGFPGAMLAGVALVSASRSSTLDRQTDLRVFLRLAAAGFFGYAVAAGLVGPAAPIFPASVINQQAFYELVGVPIQVVRAGCAVVIGIGLGRLLTAIDRQARSALRQAHDALETRVAERTQELQQANDHLLAEVDRRERLQAEVLKTEKLESLGVFAGGIAHDYNNLLTAILGCLSLADRQIDDGHPAGEALDRAEKAARKAQELAQRLLTFARGGEPNPHPCSVADILDDACSLCLSGSNVRYELDVAADTPAVTADPSQMTQVFNNIVTNGRQAMLDGGTLRVSAKPVDVVADGEGVAPGQYVRVTVVDEGGGIDPADREHVFDPFFTRRDGGSGLGLAVAHSVIQQHGGHIELTSGIGQGTSVTVLLPVSSAVPEAAPAAVAPLPQGSGRILIMDDDSMVRETAAKILRRQGYDVTTTIDGEAALAAYEAGLADGNRFSLVILDLTVPGGMGGKDTIERLRRIDPDVSAIVSSGYSTDPVAKRFTDFGFVASLAKPYGADELCRAAADVIAGPRSEPN